MRFLAASSTTKLIDEGRMSRRTIADAIEVLRSDPKFSPNMRVSIRTDPLCLPSGDVPFLLQAVCADVGLAVTLPTSNKFRAKFAHSPTGSRPEEFETPLLQGSTVEMVKDQVQVILSDGRRLRAVEIIPCHMPPRGDQPRCVQSFKRQLAVIAHIVRMNNAEDRCYQTVDDDLLPGVRRLEFNTLQDLNVPPLSAIIHHIDLNDPDLNGISRQEVANILRDWGLRLPEPRSRST